MIPNNNHVDLSRQASDHLVVTIVARRPRAVVVLLGYMGCEAKHLDAYARLYHEKKCSTIAASAPIFAIASNDTTTLGEVGIGVCREAARLVRMAELSEMAFGAVPVLFHVFGNGGCVVLEELERTIREVVPEETLEEMWTSGSITPPLLGSFRSMNKSMKRIPSLTSTLDQDFEEEGEGPVRNGLLVQNSPRNQYRSKIGMLSTSSFTSSHPTSLTSFRSCKECHFAKKPVISRRARKKKALKVHRVDHERTTFYPPMARDPWYNPEDRAYRLDLSLIASRLYNGCIVFDSAPCFPTLSSRLASAQDGIRNPVMRFLTKTTMNARNITIGSRRTLTTNGGNQAESRNDQFWTNMMQLSLTKKHVYVYNSFDSICDSAKLEELILVQSQNGMSVRQCKLLDGNSRDYQTPRQDAYAKFIPMVLDDVAEMKIHIDLEECFISSDEEYSGSDSNITSTSTSDEEKWWSCNEEGFD